MAPSYFTRLLQFDERILQLYITYDADVYIIHPAVQHAQPSAYICNRPAWFLDYKVRDYGSVVPQSVWTPATLEDARPPRRDLTMPIFFVCSDRRTLGLRLFQYAAGNWAGPLNEHAPAPVGNSHTALIRLRVSVSNSLIVVLLYEWRPLLVAWLRRTEYPDYA